MKLNTRIRLLLQTGDSLLCCFLFFPLLVCYWRGIWDLIGVYLNPDGKHQNDWLIFGIGSCSVFGYFLLPVLKRYLDPDKLLEYPTVTRVYMYFEAALFMSYWRGVWVLGDYYIGVELEHGLISFSICVLLLVCLRGVRMVIFPPLFTSLDSRPDLLDTNPRFGTRPGLTLRYVCDSLFSHFVINTFAILAWQGLWIVYNYLLFPDDHFKSDVSCLIIGYILCLLMLSLQQPLSKVSVYLGERRWIYKLVWEDCMYLVAFGSLMFLWRGGWNLNATYMIEDKLLGGWLNHVFGTIGLMTVQLFSFVSSSGVVVDGADPLGEAFYPNHYLRHYVLPVLEKKQKYAAESTYTAPPRATHSASLSNVLASSGQDNMAFVNDDYAYVTPISQRPKDNSGWRTNYTWEYWDLGIQNDRRVKIP